LLPRILPSGGNHRQLVRAGKAVKRSPRLQLVIGRRACRDLDHSVLDVVFFAIVSATCGDDEYCRQAKDVT
jgi:hypothetical protein